MFNEIQGQLCFRGLYEERKDRLTEQYNDDMSAIDTAIEALNIDEVMERKYNLAVYAKSEFRKCKDMTLEEAYKYADHLMAKEDEATGT